MVQIFLTILEIFFNGYRCCSQHRGTLFLNICLVLQHALCCNMRRLLHHASKLFVVIRVENSIIKRYDAFHLDHYVVPSFCDMALLTRTYVIHKQSCSFGVAGRVAAFA